MSAPTERERAQLLEIARLYAALIHVVASVDDPVLKSELADLIWPRATPTPEVPAMPDPVIVVDPGPLANSRKMVAELLGIFATLMVALMVPGSDFGEAVIPVVPLAIGAVVAYFIANREGLPSAKFLVALGAALGTLIVALIQHGTDEWRLAFLLFAVALAKAGATWLTPNANQTFVDAVNPA